MPLSLFGRLGYEIADFKVIGIITKAISEQRRFNFYSMTRRKMHEGTVVVIIKFQLTPIACLQVSQYSGSRSSSRSSPYARLNLLLISKEKIFNQV